MIEVCLKVPSMTIFIKGNLKNNNMTKQLGELFLKPEINLLRADTNEGGVIIIPGSNIAYMKNAKEE